jgi:hypothetical protein
MIEDPAATHLPGFKLATAGRILRLASPESVSSSSWQAPAATVAGAGTAAWPALPLAASVPECIMMMAAARDSDSDAPSRSRVARGAGRPGGGARCGQIPADSERRTRRESAIRRRRRAASSIPSPAGISHSRRGRGGSSSSSYYSAGVSLRLGHGASPAECRAGPASFRAKTEAGHSSRSA